MQTWSIMCDTCEYITEYNSAINARLQMMAHDKQCPGPSVD